MNIEIKVDLPDEPWGERHFAIEDPNGIGIDILKYIKSLTKSTAYNNGYDTLFWLVFSIPEVLFN